MTEKKIPCPLGGPGKWSNPRMVSALKTYCAIKGVPLSSIYCYQGSFNTGVEASAGTHDKADCLDVSVDTFDNALAKKIGIVSWDRTPAQGFDLHAHMVRLYTSDAAWLADAQEKAYREHKSNGLGDLSGKDTSYCPKYRGVQHLSGPTTQKYITTKETAGWKEAGCHGTTASDRSLLSVTRPKGFIVSNVAGKVRCNGSDYIVTTSGTFYNLANLKTYVAPPAGTIYYVRAPRAVGYTIKNAQSKVVTYKAWGTAVRILKTETIDGCKWGYEYANGTGRWFMMLYLQSTKPTVRYGSVGKIKVGQGNAAAQASGHAGTWPTRARNWHQHCEDEKVDVMSVQEYGSGTTKHPNGQTYLEISDAARKAIDPDLVRDPHGSKWRYILRRESTTNYLANSGRSYTLPTRVDADGTQVVSSIQVAHGNNHMQVSFHFDVNSTADELRKQARELLIWADKTRHDLGVAPWNVTIAGDTNDVDGVTEAIFAHWGFVPAAKQDGAVNSDKRTTNSWKNEFTVGPRRDEIYTHPWGASSCHPILDGVSSDHNQIYCWRTIYGKVPA